MSFRPVGKGTLHEIPPDSDKKEKAVGSKVGFEEMEPGVVLLPAMFQI